MQTYPEIAIIVADKSLREALMRQIVRGLDPITHEWDRQAMAAIDRFIAENPDDGDDLLEIAAEEAELAMCDEWRPGAHAI